ncbi:MAG TPA: hypothetical protein VNX46_04070, partial [Candidatus Acidoferrum sp.]|nr:hypothetical protein [Candidatus Acidoferrum sp.]
IATYDGSRPPPAPIISNLIGEKFGIPESWKGRVSAYFVRSAQYVGAMGQDGFLRFKAQLDGLGSPIEQENRLPRDETPAQGEQSTKGKPAPPSSRQDQEGVIVWTYPCGDKFLRIETPENMTKETWEKLNKYIQVLQP